MAQEAPVRKKPNSLACYFDAICAPQSHSGRAAAMRTYCTGLLSPGGRKSVELLAARLQPQRVQALHQSLHHMVAKAEWDDAALLGAVRGRVLSAIVRSGPVRHWVVDEVCLPKQGAHSVGVARQLCGASGREVSCQVAICLWVGNEEAGLPVAFRLFLPPAWAGDSARRLKAGVPDAVGAAARTELALDQIRCALADNVPPGVVLGGFEYGGDADFRSGVSGLGLSYALRIPLSTGVWPSPAGAEPVLAAEYAAALPLLAWRRAGRTGASSRFAAARINPAAPSAERADEWLLMERPDGRVDPARFWLSNLPTFTTLKELVRCVEGGYRIERDRRELEQEIGLAHYEGRGWRGFHHHASLCIAAYGFVVAGRCLRPRQRASERLALHELPLGFRPRGASRP
ncbi:MAG: IS701 family transposase [Janthinobacterium lividum]